MSAIPDFTISKLRITGAPPNDKGNSLLATFNLHISGIVVVGCVLIESAAGIVRTAGPIGRTMKGHTATTHIRDADLLRAVTRRAAAIYGGLTGREVTDE